MKEIVNEYKEYLLNSHKSENTVYAYVTDVNLYIKYLNYLIKLILKKIQL